MQYSVKGSDGNQYGPVDLMTLKQWAKEGRVLPATMVTDHLSNRTAAASSMSELGFTTNSNPYTGVQPPPSNYTDYPRTGQAVNKSQGTHLWSILIWLGIGIILSLFTRTGGLIASGWNIYDAMRARQQRDPHAGLCIGFAVGGFALILIWTIIKANTLGSS